MADQADGPAVQGNGGEAQPHDEFKVFVGGISWQLQDRDLKELFRDYGAEDAQIMLDKITNRSRGFGFVSFRDKQGMEDAIRDKHDTEVEGRRISVKRAIPQDQAPPPAYDRRGPRPYDRGYPGGGRDPYYGGGGGRPYERSYDRGYAGVGGGGYGGRGYDRSYGAAPAYERDPYYGRSYEGGGGGYGGGGGGGYGGGYDRGYPAYDQRSYGGASYDRYPSHGPERTDRGYGAPRAGPYDRYPPRR